jgi:hypothetical protein
MKKIASVYICILLVFIVSTNVVSETINQDYEINAESVLERCVNRYKMNKYKAGTLYIAASLYGMYYSMNSQISDDQRTGILIGLPIGVMLLAIPGYTEKQYKKAMMISNTEERNSVSYDILTKLYKRQKTQRYMAGLLFLSIAGYLFSENIPGLGIYSGLIGISLFQQYGFEDFYKRDFRTVSTDSRLTPVNISIMPPISLFKRPKVVGLDLNLIGKSEQVKGIQIGLFSSNVEGTLYGLQTTIFSGHTNNFYGIQASIMNSLTSNGNGLQIAFNNDAEDFTGIQTSILGNSAYDFKGIQLSIASNMSTEVAGVQIGAINYAETLRGIQIGFINIAKNSPILPYMIGFNIGWQH